MDGPLDFLMRPAAPTEGGDVRGEAPDRGPTADDPLGFLMQSASRRSAKEIVDRGRFAGRDWADTAGELKKAGYAAPDEMGVHYEQQRKLAAEVARQGEGVSTLEQLAKNAIPFGSAVLGNRREVAAGEATKRFQQGKATDADIETIATHDRRQRAEASINSTLPGQLLNVLGQAPAILGETAGAGKVLGAVGKATGIGQAAAQTTGRAVVNYAGRAAVMTPLVPSLYVEKATQKNLSEGRDPNDVRGYVPAVGLGYANMLVLGSLQKFGNAGSFADQVVQKGAIGVGEQALADTGVSLIDEFLPKAYKTDTRYGALGDIARGDVGEGLRHATVQMFTFSYFAGLHGKQPDRAAEAFRASLAASFKAGLNPDAAAKVAGRPAEIITDALKANPDLTAEGARDALKPFENTLGEAGRRYGDTLADVLPKQSREKPGVRPFEFAGDPTPEQRAFADDVGRKLAEVRGEKPAESPPAEAPPEPPGSSDTKTEPAAPQPDKVVQNPIDRLSPGDKASLAKQLGVKESALKTVRGADVLADAVLKAREGPPQAEPAPSAPPPAPEPVAPPAQSQRLSLAEGRATGEKDHQGNPLTVHDIRDASGTPVGEAKVFQSGGTLHVHWLGMNGMAGGEGRGNNPAGAREMLRLLPELAKAYPDAVVAKYTPSEGRIKAGEVKWIDLEKVRQRGEAADRRTAQTTESPGRRATDQAPAPQEPETTPPPKLGLRPDLLAKARARTAEAVAKTAAPVTPHADERTAPERRQDDRIDTTRYEDVPRVYRQVIERYLPDLAAAGKSADAVREAARVAFGASGPDGVEALAELYHARFGDVTAKMLDVAEAKAKKAQEEFDHAVEAVGDVERGTEAGDRRSAEAAARLRRAVEDRLREADGLATQVADGGGTAAPAGAKEPGQTPRPKLTADHKAVQKIAKGASAEAKPYFEDALYNMKAPDFEFRFHTTAPAEDARRLDTLFRLDEARRGALGAGVVKAERELRAAMKKLGAEDHGPGVGATVDYDGRYYDPGEHAVGPATKVVVESRPLAFKGTEVAKGMVRPAGAKAPAKPKSLPRVKTVADRVIEEGGIKFDSAMEGHYGSQKDAREDGLNRPRLFSDRGTSLDVLAMRLKMTEAELLDKIKKGVPDRDADNARAFEAAAERQTDTRARDTGDTMGEYTPSDEEIPLSRGQARPGAPPADAKGGKPSSFDLIAAQDKLFGVRNYVEKTIPGAPADAKAAARLRARATITDRYAAGDELVNLEEHAHHLQKEFGLPADPREFPEVVARGLQQFFAPRQKAYEKEGAVSRTAMIEGFADWLISRTTDRLTGLTDPQRVADRFLENWAKEKGLTAKFDKLREMYRSAAGRTEGEKAAGNVSATGRPAAVVPELRERVQSIAERADELVDNNLAVLGRLDADAKAKGHTSRTGEEAYTVYSQLMHADKARAVEFEAEGVHTYEDGRKVVIGLPFEKITEGARPEWLQPGENGEASKAGTYAVARHVLGEAKRGAVDLVSPEQMKQYERAFEEFQKDAEFAAWAEPFAKRLTDAFNASRRALAGKDVHFLTPDEVKQWEKDHPDYVPTERVNTDKGWNVEGGRKIVRRSGSGEQIVDPLLTYKNRLRVTSALMGEQLKRIAVDRVLKQPGMGEWAVSAGEGLNKLGQLRADALEKLGFEGDQLRNLLKDMGGQRGEEYFSPVPWPKDGTKPTWGLRNEKGEYVNYRIGDKALYDLISGQQVEANALASWLRALGNFYPVKLMTQAVKFGATSASLGFQFRNVPRDVYTFWANTIDRASVKDLPDAYRRAYAFAWAQLTGHFGAKGSTDTLFSRFVKDRGDTLRQFSFDKDRPETAYAPDRSKAVQSAHTVWGILKDTLNVAGAGELAPRFVEWKTQLQHTTGKTEAQLAAELGAAEKAAAEGRHVPDPIPLALALDAMNKAAEVTVNFNRLGTLTREMNKITPFFGPAIAGMSKAVRNWKQNPKGAAFALAGLMGARLLHWLMYSDEDWYKELSANDRYSNFIVPTPVGLRRLPAPRDLEVAAGGLLTLSLDAAARKNPDMKGYLRQSLGAVAPPAPVPPLAKTGYDIATNENWMGTPIVPRRDENTSTAEKWVDHRAGYAAEQLTGGLLSGRKIPSEAKDLIPYSEVRNARRSVDEFYDRFKDLEQARQDATRAGTRFDDEAEYKRMAHAQQQIVALSRATRGEKLVNGKVVKGEEPAEEKKQELRTKQLELARRALGR